MAIQIKINGLGFGVNFIANPIQQGTFFGRAQQIIDKKIKAKIKFEQFHN
jgi:hypothetical protein